jgi:hypothetical protein
MHRREAVLANPIPHRRGVKPEPARDALKRQTPPEQLLQRVTIHVSIIAPDSDGKSERVFVRG